MPIPVHWSNQRQFFHFCQCLNSLGLFQSLVFIKICTTLVMCKSIKSILIFNLFKQEVGVCMCAFFSTRFVGFQKKFQDFTIALCVCLYKKYPNPKPMKAPKRCVRQILFHTIKHFFLSLYLLQCVSITSKAPQMKSQSLKLNFSVCFSKHVHNDRDRSNDLWSQSLEPSCDWVFL